eukprot:scaffold4209_cov121-Skeletonema_dohrnii-CCMP3373.AAC.1
MISNRSKRRKTAANASSQGITCPHIYDLLPGGILKEVASFLAPTSRALFAVAITPTPSSPYDIILARCRPRVSRSSIAGSDWHTLDFGDIEKELAAKLTDDDISQVLLHIDAGNKVKRLRLTNCINISGSGLAPLLGCTSIEQIDLSLVEAHQLPQLDPAPQLSCGQVFPILESIINQERNSLKHLQFPHVWRDKKHYSYSYSYLDFRFLQFLERYDGMLENSLTACCGTRLDLADGLIFFGDEDFGVQDHTCSECIKNYCYKCTDEYGNKLVHFCHTCERNYCTTCTAMVECSSCAEYVCVDCAPLNDCANPSCTNINCKGCRSECEVCNKKWCHNCEDCPFCENCYEVGCCFECSDKEGVNGVYWCDICESYSCDKCRVKQCQSGGNNCKECARIISPLLLEENKKLQEELKSLKDRNKEVKTLVEENKKMQVENTELRDEVKRLKYGNKSLWDQNTTLGVEIEDLTMKMRAIRMMAS